MTTYFKHDNGNFIPAEISSEDAIAILIQSAVINAVNKVNDIIINAVIARVNDAVSDANIQNKVEAHLSTMDIGVIVEEAASNAVQEYSYDSAIENALDGVDIDEMVTEKVTDHLDSCSIQVRIN